MQCHITSGIKSSYVYSELRSAASYFYGNSDLVFVIYQKIRKLYHKKVNSVM